MRRDKEYMKYHALFLALKRGEEGAIDYDYLELPTGEVRLLTAGRARGFINSTCRITILYRSGDLRHGLGPKRQPCRLKFRVRVYRPTAGGWRTSLDGLKRLAKQGGSCKAAKTLRFKKYFDDFPSAGRYELLA